MPVEAEGGEVFELELKDLHTLDEDDNRVFPWWLSENIECSSWFDIDTVFQIDQTYIILSI
jgi:hypothetical protein